MHYKVRIFDEKIFLKDLSKIGALEKKNIFKRIEKLWEDPDKNTQVKRLKNYPVADFRMRVGEYRILFSKNIETKEIYIFRILHRSKLY